MAKNLERAAKPDGPLDVKALRSQAFTDGNLPGGTGRRASFPAQLRGQTVKLGNKLFYDVEGYATVFERGYTMWDMFGSYTETADAHMLDRSLAMRPDVAFLVNHSGVTMARSTNPDRLKLSKDETGLKVNALLNMDRSDVRDLATAIDDNDVTEMSFAFMINEGIWNDDFDQFRLLEVDIDRGDVSAVNYGANPYTSIGARAQGFMRDLEAMPESVRTEVVTLIATSDNGPAVMRAANELSARADTRYKRAAEEMAQTERGESLFANWAIEDLTGDEDDASTGEFAKDEEKTEERSEPEPSGDENSAEQSDEKTEQRSKNDDSVSVFARQWAYLTDDDENE